MPTQTVSVLKREPIARHGANPYQGVTESINRQAEHGQQIADLLPLKQTTEMEDRNAVCLKRHGDLVKPPVGSTEDRLVAKSDPSSFELTDAHSHTLGFIIQRLETSDLRGTQALPTIGA